MNRLYSWVLPFNSAVIVLASVSFANAQLLNNSGPRMRASAAKTAGALTGHEVEVSPAPPANPPSSQPAASVVKYVEDDKTFFINLNAAVRSQNVFKYSTNEPALDHGAAEELELIERGSKDEFYKFSNVLTLPAIEPSIQHVAMVGRNRTDVTILARTTLVTDDKGNLVKGYDGKGKPILVQNKGDQALMAKSEFYKFVDGQFEKVVVINGDPGTFERDADKLEACKAFIPTEKKFWKDALDYHVNVLKRTFVAAAVDAPAGTTPTLASAGR